MMAMQCSSKALTWQAVALVLGSSGAGQLRCWLGPLEALQSGLIL